MKRIIYIVNIVLMTVLIAAASNLPVYSHYCHGMDRQGVFYECYPGERDGNADTDRDHADNTHEQQVKAVPCCMDREVPHSMLDTGILPEFPMTKRLGDTFHGALLPQPSCGNPIVRTCISASERFREPPPLPLYRTCCSYLL